MVDWRPRAKLYKTDHSRVSKHDLFQGDSADAVFYIQAGKVKLSVVLQEGKKAVVAILEERVIAKMSQEPLNAASFPSLSNLAPIIVVGSPIPLPYLQPYCVWQDAASQTDAHTRR